MIEVERKSSSFSTADLWDAHHDVLQSLGIPWLDYGARRAFWGAVETIATQQDVQAIRQVLDQPGEGRILLIDAGASLHFALVGDRLAQRAISNGWVGVIVHGAIRDSTALGDMLIGVKALGTTARRPFACDDPALIGIPLDLSVTVKPGDFLYCDSDDVLVSTHNLLFRDGA